MKKSISAVLTTYVSVTLPSTPHRVDLLNWPNRLSILVWPRCRDRFALGAWRSGHVEQVLKPRSLIECIERERPKPAGYFSFSSSMYTQLPMLRPMLPRQIIGDALRPLGWSDQVVHRPSVITGSKLSHRPEAYCWRLQVNSWL